MLYAFVRVIPRRLNYICPYKIQTPGNYPEGSIQPLHLFLKRNLTRTFEQTRIHVHVRVFMQTCTSFYQIPCNTKYFHPPFISNNAVARGNKGLPHSSLYSYYKLSFSLSFLCFSVLPPHPSKQQIRRAG